MVVVSQTNWKKTVFEKVRRVCVIFKKTYTGWETICIPHIFTNVKILFYYLCSFYYFTINRK